MGTPAAVVLRPLEQNDMPHREVKRFSRCSENWNLTDVLEQQGPSAALGGFICGITHQGNKDYNKIICLA
jgi:hypothetical protein